MKQLGIFLLLASTVAFGQNQNKKTGWDAAKLKVK